MASPKIDCEASWLIRFFWWRYVNPHWPSRKPRQYLILCYPLMHITCAYKVERNRRKLLHWREIEGVPACPPIIMDDCCWWDLVLTAGLLELTLLLMLLFASFWKLAKHVFNKLSITVLSFSLYKKFKKINPIIHNPITLDYFLALMYFFTACNQCKSYYY